ncbi:MAG: hypothetical protein HYY93_05770 [Planctomycetes bacterium]|nr:hypothetical protein [Planctomycetota bacterium]
MKRTIGVTALLLTLLAGLGFGLGTETWTPSLSTIERGMSRDLDLLPAQYPVCTGTLEEIHQRDLAVSARLRGTFGEVGALAETAVEDGLAGSAAYPLEERDSDVARRELEEALVEEAKGGRRTGRGVTGGSSEWMEDAARAQASATASLQREIIEEANREIIRIRTENALLKSQQ